MKKEKDVTMEIVNELTPLMFDYFLALAIEQIKNENQTGDNPR